MCYPAKKKLIEPSKYGGTIGDSRWLNWFISLGYLGFVVDTPPCGSARRCRWECVLCNNIEHSFQRSVYVCLS
jgi:hypothetical protein